MIEGASVKCLSADENLAVLEVTPIFAGEVAETRAATGVIRGPYSNSSRTLPAEFKLVAGDNDKLHTKIVDPCYSSSDLRMEYELVLWIEGSGDSAIKYTTRFELQRKRK